MSMDAKFCRPSINFAIYAGFFEVLHNSCPLLTAQTERMQLITLIVLY